MLRARGLQRLDLHPLDFDLAPSECVGISGASGSGKTVFLRMLADLDPHAGQVFLDDDEQSTVPPSAWRQRVAMLPAESRWWDELVGPHFAAGRVPDPAAFGFDDDPSDWPVERLSSGERQRLALARVLELGPRVLLLDEPTANLDDQNVTRIERLVGDWRRGERRGVVWVSHDLEQLARVADRHLVLAEGRWRAA